MKSENTKQYGSDWVCAGKVVQGQMEVIHGHPQAPVQPPYLNALECSRMFQNRLCAAKSLEEKRSSKLLLLSKTQGPARRLQAISQLFLKLPGTRLHTQEHAGHAQRVAHALTRAAHWGWRCMAASTTDPPGSLSQKTKASSTG